MGPNPEGMSRDYFPSQLIFVDIKNSCRFVIDGSLRQKKAEDAAATFIVHTTCQKRFEEVPKRGKQHVVQTKKAER